MTDEERDELLRRLEVGQAELRGMLTGMGTRLDTLTGEVETLRRDVRQQHAELQADLPAAAVVRAVQPADHRDPPHRTGRKLTPVDDPA